ncbi:helix-turn-helix domain-containing protein [Lysobacter capsici]|nr:helix-turn-helix domain-containing protein [Lysobacter capsici]
MTALALGANRQARETSGDAYRAALLQQALRLIETNLTDSSLNAEWIARQLNISRRGLELLFERRGISVATWIGRRRIEESRRRLEDPAQRQFSIASIAFLVGFTDLSTFNRRFRSQYGITPSDLRWGVTPRLIQERPHEAPEL